MTTPEAETKSPDDSSDPKYRVIAGLLRGRILAGDYGGGRRLPSEAALVARHGVSRPTAARALQELVREGLVERRAGMGSFAVENPAAGAGRRELGLLTPQWETTEIFEKICAQLAGLARARDFGMFWKNAKPPAAPPAGENAKRAASEAETAGQLCDEFIKRKLDGVFFAPLELSANRREVNQRIAGLFQQAGIPVVLIDRELAEFPQRGALDLASMDNIAAGSLIASHLLKLGCRRIAFFTRPRSAPTVAARIAGVREAMVRAGTGGWDGDSVIEGDPSDAALVRRALVRRRWDACVCANDRTAAQLMQTLLRLGVRVPRDLRVAGFDDAKYATLVAVPLTTVHQPCDEIAALAFDAMLRRLANPLAPPCAFLATPRLVVRESCGTYLPR
ncbi:MAG: GntR family transcriptional regulator [Opitutaceae bacterium]|jgi:LacI family transcriptional regulator|nr:GntR family transcriptional regulator [Opitutaceae bacterium]